MSILQRLRNDTGVTLIETLIVMLLLGVVGSLVTDAVVNSSRNLTHVDDENTGLQDAKVILERMGRDLRDARGIVCDGGLADPAVATSGDPLCRAHLQMWVDSNSDYARQESEVITWRLKGNTDGVHYDVIRTVGSGLLGNVAVSREEASTLIVNIAFDYDTSTQPNDAQVVHIGMNYDAIVGRGTGFRKVAFSVRLRNKGTV